MTLQVNIFILLFGGLQALLLTLFLIWKKFYRIGYVFLLLYFAAILLQIAMKVMNKIWLMENWGGVYEVSHFLPLIYGPLVLFFTQGTLFNKKFQIINVLHFLPFAFLLALLIAPVVFPYSNREMEFLYRRDIGMMMQLVSLSIYHWMAFQCWNRYKDSLKGCFSELVRLQMNWIKHFIIASAIVGAIISIAIFLIYVNHPQSLPYRYLFAILTIFIYWVSYTALTKPAVFSVIKGYGGEINTAINSKLVVHHPVKKYANSGLSKEEQANILVKLQKTMMVQKPYLNPELSINELAAMTKCNRHHLSQALNESLNQSFYEYVNHYRVEEAKQFLCDKRKAEHKIASIAFDAGFNSISTFNEVFKKFAGHTPTEFRKQFPQVSQKERV